MMKVLVTGASGFIGKAIVNRLSKKQLQITTLERAKPTELPAYVNKKKQYYADITKKEDFENLPVTAEIDTVIHCAGLAHQFGTVSPEDFKKVNVFGTKNVSEWAAKKSVKLFILISSVSVYENSKSELNKNVTIDEKFYCDPKTFYALSKFEAENICKEICKINKIPLVILRLATVVGEEDKGNFIRLIRSIDKGKFFWIGKGVNKKSIIHKSEVARVCEKILERKIESDFEIYNISAKPIRVKQIVKVISEVLDKKVLKVYIPAKPLKWFIRFSLRIFRINKISKLLDTIEKWLAEDIYSAEKFNKEFKFKIKITPEEAIRREVVWYQKHK